MGRAINQRLSKQLGETCISKCKSIVINQGGTLMRPHVLAAVLGWSMPTTESILFVILR